MNSNRARAEYGNFKEIEVKITTKDGHTFIYQFQQRDTGPKSFAEIKYNIDTYTDDFWNGSFIRDQRREFVLSIKS